MLPLRIELAMTLTSLFLKAGRETGANAARTILILTAKASRRRWRRGEFRQSAPKGPWSRLNGRFAPKLAVQAMVASAL
jgi:hypothetical protein